MKAAMQADAAWAGGDYDSQPEKGFRAFMTVTAGWFASQTFFRRGLHLTMLGMQHDSMQEFLAAMVQGFSFWDANDLICMIHTWQSSDVSNHPNFNGDFKAALGSIKCPAMVMPCETDLYFPPEDNEIEVGMMSNAELRVIPSVYGHIAGHPGMAPPEDHSFIDQGLNDLLARS